MPVSSSNPDPTQRPRFKSFPVRGHPPVLLIPGLCGSRLIHNQLIAWPCTAAPLTSLNVLRWPNKQVIADEVVTEWDIAGLLRFNTGYGQLRSALTRRFGYRRGENLVEFAYDWRQDCRRSAVQLRAHVQTWKREYLGANPQIVILAHSMGGLVARYWIERLGGAADVSALILIGSPLDGTPLAFEYLVRGAPFIPFHSIQQKLAAVVQTMPAIYQLLPSRPFVFTPTGEPVDIYTEREWLPSRYHALLDDSRAFYAELGRTSSVPTVTIIGRGVPTAARIIVDTQQPDAWCDARIERDGHGDGLVPVASARLAGGREHVVACDHEALLTHECVFRFFDPKMMRPAEQNRSVTRREGALSVAA
ncbi:MAG: hypothetical protein M5U01_05545 [Ardenticatenaceae bacterium]|nr:hypothetical protein [Ardenticatenaceae bacterium]HBY97904.1 hypothetical protein [Chloroflexota bacterium]